MEMHIPMHVVTEEVLTRLPAKPLMSFSKLLSEMPIPMHVVTEEILTRLPAKSLMRFKCDVNDQHSSVTLSLVPDANSDTPSSSSFVVDLTIPRMRGGYICQNLRGLIIWCPFDRYARGKVPSSGLCPQTWKTRRRFLGKGESTSSSDFIPHTAARGGVCIDGVIYYLGWTAADECMLVSFRIRSHKFKMIQVPLAEDLPPPPKMKNVCLVEYSGKATVVDQTNLRDKGMLDLWALEDAANKKWSSKRLVLKPCQLDFVTNVEFVVREHRELFYVLPRDDVNENKGFRNEGGDM
ncbi:hypothetical protein Rs2_48434 [Raphanus sativus]|nr:hypothetical protein Rs2_48434 [Raphanus sativus]